MTLNTVVRVDLDQMLKDQIQHISNALLNDLELMLKDLVQQYGHLSFVVQQCIASPNPTGALSASRIGGHRHHLGFLLCSLLSPRPSHPTIGHRHQGNLRL